MLRRLALSILFASLCATAHADPATHTFAVTSAQTGPGDCGGGSCTNVCRWEAKVTNVSPREMPSASLNFKYPHPGLDPGQLATTAFGIPDLRPGESQTIVEWIYGLRCSEVLIRGVSAKCSDFRCPYAAIRILPATAPRLISTKVDIDP
jgi:hypothetical protein